MVARGVALRIGTHAVGATNGLFLGAVEIFGGGLAAECGVKQQLTLEPLQTAHTQRELLVGAFGVTATGTLIDSRRLRVQIQSAADQVESVGGDTPAARITVVA